MKCPVDSATLLMSERQGVEIDYCPECRGVWLDRGELDKLLRQADDDWDDNDRGRGRQRIDARTIDTTPTRPRRRRRGGSATCSRWTDADDQFRRSATSLVSWVWGATGGRA